MASPAHSAAILKIPPPARQLADSLCHLQGHQGTTHLAVHLLECRQMFGDNFQIIRESIKRPRYALGAFPVQGRSENLSSPGLRPHCQCGTSGSRGKCQSLQETMPLCSLLTHQGSQVGMYLVAWSLKTLSNNAAWPLPLQFQVCRSLYPGRPSSKIGSLSSDTVTEPAALLTPILF